MPGSISWHKLIQRLRCFGFDGPYAGGRHLFMKKNDSKVIVPNPHEGDISRHLLSEILRQAGITSKAWRDV